jgi:subtilisin-like proprotein convertase family protein
MMKKQFTRLIRGCCALIFLLAISATGAYAQYCNSGASSTADEFISQVSYQSFTNSSGVNTANSVDDFTDLGSIGTISPGIPSTITVEISNPFLSDDVNVYIDSNGDGEFQADENVGFGEATSPLGSPEVVDIELSVPADAVLGETQIRVQMSFGTSDGPCDTFTWGDVEDYRIDIVEGDCTPPAFDYYVVDDCENNTYDILVNFNNFNGNGTVTFFTSSSNPDYDDDELPQLSFILEGEDSVAIYTDIPFGDTVTFDIQVGPGSPCNSFESFINGICPPDNDSCDEATSLDCGDSVNGTTIGAAQFPDGFNFCDAGPADDASGIWYSLNFTNANQVTLDIVGDAFNRYYIYEGSCDSLVCVTSGSSAGASTAVFEAFADQDYYILLSESFSGDVTFSLDVSCEEILCTPPALATTVVDGDGNEVTDCVEIGTDFFVDVVLSGGEGNSSYEVSANGDTDTLAVDGSTSFGPFTAGTLVDVSVVGIDDPLCNVEDNGLTADICPPENDTCVEAISLACGDSVTGTTVGAAQFPDGFNFCDAGPAADAGGIWYSVNFANPNQVTLDIEGDAFNRYYIYEGSCDSLVCVTSGSSVSTSTAVFEAFAGQNYYILLSESFSGDVNFSLDVSCEEILCTPPALSTTVVDGDGNEITDCVEAGTEFFVDVVLSGGEGNSSYEVSANGDTDTLAVDGSTSFGPFNAGTLVDVSVVGIDDPLCNVSNNDLTASVCPPENDTCADAFDAVCGVTYDGSTIGTLPADGQEYCGTSSPSSDNGGAWYSLVLPGAGQSDVTIDLSGSNYDTKLFLYSGECDSLTCVDGDDDGGDGLQSLLEATLDGGTQYYIYVSGFSSNQGIFTMNISCVNEACSPDLAATAVADSNGTAIDDCVDQTGNYFVEVALSGGANNSAYDVSVNGGASVSVASGSSAIVGPVPALEAANISVVGQDDATCSADTTVSIEVCPPSNDQPCDAIGLTVDGMASVPYTNQFATVDSNEVAPPNGGCSTDSTWCDNFGEPLGQLDNSIWFTFTGPASGRVQLDGCGDNSIDNQFAVYTAGDCNDYSTFELVGANDDRTGDLDACTDGSIFSSGFELCVEPGETYYLQVDGYNGAIGPSVITLTEVDGDFCSCVFPDIFVSTEPDCSDSTYVTTVTINDFGSSDSFDYLAIVNDDTTVFEDISDTLDIPGTPLGTSITLVVVFDEESGCSDITNFQATVAQGGDACDPDCEGVPAGPAQPGTACTTDEGEDGVYNQACDCVADPQGDCGEYTGGLPGQTVDSGTLTDTIFIDNAPGMSITDLNVAVQINSTFLADVDVSLIAPDGTVIDLFTDFCGGGDNANVLLDDEADSALTCEPTGSDPVLFGTYQPEGNLSDIDGIAANGAWVLDVTDDLGGFPAELVSWCLIPEFGPLEGASLAGSVDINGNCAPVDATVDVYEPGTATLVDSYTVSVDVDGNFMVPDVATGTYDIIVKVDGYLAKGVAGVEILDGSNDLIVGAVTAGDVNNDNSINIVDASNVNAAFDSVDGDVDYDEAADLNCDGFVNIVDASIINASFNEQGATAPLN